MEAALREHLARLGLPPVPVIWAEDADAGVQALPLSQASKDWRQAVKTARRPVWRALAWHRLWTEAAGVRAQARQAAYAAFAPVKDEIWQGYRIWQHIQPHWAPGFYFAADAAVTAIEHAALYAIVGSMPGDGAIAPLLQRLLDISQSLVEAAVAGLWCFRVTIGGIVAIPRPARLQFARVQNELQWHHESGPVIAWESGASYWFWRGLPVSQQVIEAPASLTVEQIDAAPTLSLRYAMIQRFGVDRYLAESGRAVPDHAAQARALIDRIAAVDLTTPVYDPVLAGAAVTLHLRRLGLRPLPVRWMPDIAALAAELNAMPARSNAYRRRIHASDRQQAAVIAAHQAVSRIKLGQVDDKFVKNKYMPGFWQDAYRRDIEQALNRRVELSWQAVALNPILTEAGIDDRHRNHIVHH